MAIDEPKEPIMTAGEAFESGFGSNSPQRRGIETKVKPVKQIITAGEATDAIDSTRQKVQSEKPILTTSDVGSKKKITGEEESEEE